MRILKPNQYSGAVPSAAPRTRRQQLGFTLIELMITAAIIAILAAIALPSYRNNIVKTRRGSAAACLLEASQFMERWYTTRLTYAGADPALPCEAPLASFYTFPAPGTATATAYTLTAVPAGVQATHDTLCGTMGINQQGTKTESGTATAAYQCF